MPELPEVETTLRGIQPQLENTTITRLNVRNRQLRWPVPDDLAEKLQNQPILSLKRRAKYLLIIVPTGTLMIHLGMSGNLRVLPPSTELKKHDHIDLTLSNGQVLRYHDPRRFGAWLFTEKPIEEHPLIHHLAPEPLSDRFDSEWLFQKIHHRKSAIKTLIMNNQIAVGVGNIYANESLFLSGIHPIRKGSEVSKEEVIRLVKNIKIVLQKAIQQGGTTLKDFLSPDGKPGYFSQQLHVYGREGEACLTCQTQIQKRVLNQRAAYFCSQCQK